MNDDADEKKIKIRQTVFAIIIGVLVGVILVVCIVLGLSDNFGGSQDGSDSSSGTTITVSGTHELTGKHECIIVNTTHDVRLILNNAKITCESGPAIYIEESGDVEIVLKGENTVSATTNDDLEGVIHSKEDLVFSGDGKLTLNGNLDGIVSKDTLTIKDGNYVIETGDDCIKGKDSVEISGGTFDLTSTGGDGIKSSNDEDAKLGFVYITDGEFKIKTGADGIQSETYTTIDGGKFNIEVGDDGIHATTKLEINDGNITISCREGLEATYVVINDGTINITASDDGINAGQKSDAMKVGVEINGGKLTIDMGAGDTDAIDSNGFLKIAGGTIDITGQSPFDYDGDLTYSGGTIIVNGETVNEVTNQFMGGDMGGPGDAGGPGMGGDSGAGGQLGGQPMGGPGQMR